MLLATRMTENESASRDECRKLGEIFVSVTGKTGTTERQSQDQKKKVISVTESRASSRQKRLDTDSRTDGLDDAIGDPSPGQSRGE